MNIGAKAVKDHADEFGLSDGISAIVRAFGKDSIKDIEIISEGRRTALKEISRDAYRLAVSTKPSNGIKHHIQTLRNKK